MSESVLSVAQEQCLNPSYRSLSRGHAVGLTFVKLEAKNRLDLNAYSPRKSPRPKVPISLDFASRKANTCMVRAVLRKKSTNPAEFCMHY